MRRALLLATLVTGCSFPDPTIDDSLVIDSGFPDTRTDTSSDASVMDTAMVDSAAETSPADTKPSVCETMNECDCDGDGDEAKQTGCAGNDCDDGDPRRNSKVTSFQEYSLDGVTGHKGDWDCSGKETTEYAVGVTCTGLLVGDCSKQGYKESMVTCGANATFVRCKWNGIACGEDASATTTIKVKCK